jgi:hypothetical protein
MPEAQNEPKSKGIPSLDHKAQRNRQTSLFRTLTGVSVRLLDAGHILGSTLVPLNMEEGGSVRRLVCFGDIGQHYDAEASKLGRRLHGMPRLQNLRLRPSGEKTQTSNRLHGGAAIRAPGDIFYLDSFELTKWRH